VAELEDVAMPPGKYPAASAVAGGVTHLDLASELLPIVEIAHSRQVTLDRSPP